MELYDRREDEPSARVPLFTCAHPGLHEHLAEISLPRAPIEMMRRHSVYEHPIADSAPTVPEGCELQAMAPSLLDDPDLTIDSEIQEKLYRWQRTDGPPLADYGVVAVHTATRTAAAWATVGYICNGVGDVGLVKRPEHRRKGLALATTSAALRRGPATAGCTRFSWAGAADNVASIRTAERLGFRRCEDYVLHLFSFDSTQHTASWP